MEMAHPYGAFPELGSSFYLGGNFLQSHPKKEISIYIFMESYRIHNSVFLNIVSAINALRNMPVEPR
jgi:hypothetical protein